MHRKSRHISCFVGLIVMTVLQLATIVSATLNLIMSFMSLRCNCMICLAFYLSFDMQRLCMIELEMSISRSFAQRK